jgi:hypothetical protein
MSSLALGKTISEVEVTNIDKHGIWILFQGEELFLPYDKFPWFKEAKISDILSVELAGKNHLYWAELDVDLMVDSIKEPEGYPLVYKE